MSDTITITINAVYPSLTTPSNANQTVSTEENIEEITFTTNDAEAEFSVTGLPEGISAVQTGVSYVISGSSSVIGSYDYKVNVTVDGISVESSATITIEEEPTAVEESEKMAWKQSKNEVYVENAEVEELRLYSMSGALKAKENGKQSISTSSIADGESFVVVAKLRNQSKTQSSKFLK